MITVEEFRRRWLDGYQVHYEEFNHYEELQIQQLRLPPEQAHFLEKAGLPKFAGALYFGEPPKALGGTPYTIIGEYHDEELIVVDTSGTGHVFSIQKTNKPDSVWCNASIPILCESLLLYLELCKKANAINGRQATRRNDIPDFLIEQFEEDVRIIDARAVEDKEAFWNREIRYRRSHCADPKKRIFGPTIPLTASMTEVEFVGAIDCRFYFRSVEGFEHAVRVGCSISDNAALMVGYELAIGFPKGHVPFRFRLLNLLKHERPTEVVLLAAPIIESLIIDVPVDGQDLRRLLEYCNQHPGQFNAVNLIGKADLDEELGAEYDRASLALQAFRTCDGPSND